MLVPTPREMLSKERRVVTPRDQAQLDAEQARMIAAQNQMLIVDVPVEEEAK